MKVTCPDSWILVAALATASCAGRYQVGTETGTGGASGSTGSQVTAGSQVTTGPAVTTGSDVSTTGASTGAGGSATVGTGGQGGMPGPGPSRCGFMPDGAGSSAPTASAMVILSRIVRFLDNSPNVPPAMAPSPPTAEWASAQAAAILDDHYVTGTEAPGLVRFLAGWLKAPVADAGLSASSTWAFKLLDPNATLATLLTSPTSDPRRNGILTDQQVLSARPTISSRGAWMSDKLLCSPIPAAPANLPVGPKIPGATRREQLESDVSLAPCQGCHTMMDPGGFSLEHFDEVGNYREIDNGKPVDSSGSIRSPMLMFSGIDNLAPQLAESCLVAQCFARLMMSDAFGIDPATGNFPFTEEEINHVANAFANSSFSIRELVKAIVATPSFLR